MSVFTKKFPRFSNNSVDTIRQQFNHTPIMVSEVQKYLALEPGGLFVDCTFGGGGHSKNFLHNFPNIKIIAIDRDPEAECRANVLKKEFDGRFDFFSSRFSKLKDLPIADVDGIFFDFGISSIQLDDPQRGFSFKNHTKMDMRMNSSTGITAHEFLKTASERELIETIRDFGEEKYWRRIVDWILLNRNTDRIVYADIFAQELEKIIPNNFKSKIHPATKTFQGIRIAINQELQEIRSALPDAFDLLKSKGRLVTLSFHSLEDRIVKQFFNLKAGKAISKHESFIDRPTLAEIITKKVITPSDNEIKSNPRSRSTKLRALRKL